MRARIPLSVAIATVAAVLAVSANSPDPTTAATVSARWSTPIQVPGARPQGTATLYAYASGTGSLSLRLAGLRPGATFSVRIYTGTCSNLRARVVLLPTVTSSMAGTVARGLALNRTLTARLRTLLRGGHLSVTVGTLRRCGTLVRASLAPSPTPTPSPTPGATPTPTPTATPTPTPTPTPTATPIPMPSPTPYVYPTPTPYIY
jgi:hypothetical protein